jgi:hypothetical protein
MILNGRGRGQKATLLKINEDTFNCDVRLDDSSKREIQNVDYEDISKIADF